MTSPIDPNAVLMTGENSFIRLSADGGKTQSDRISHWRVLWCPAGAGHALFVQSTLTDGAVKVYADNEAVARWLQATIESLLYPAFADPKLPVAKAQQQSVVVARIRVRECLERRRRDRAARRVHQRSMQPALRRAGVVDRMNLRAQQVGAQKVVGDHEMPRGVPAQQMKTACPPEIRHQAGAAIRRLCAARCCRRNSIWSA